MMNLPAMPSDDQRSCAEVAPDLDLDPDPGPGPGVAFDLDGDSNDEPPFARAAPALVAAATLDDAPAADADRAPEVEPAPALVDPDEVDALFRGPLSEFTAERNRLAERVKASDRDAAADIKALAKPTVSAWAANQAYWDQPEVFMALIDAGEELRALQARAASAAELTAASTRLRQALAPVIQAAQEALARAGHGRSPQIMRRVVTTLEALAAYGRAAAAPRAGRLSNDVAAPGFAVASALTPAAPARPRVRRPPLAAPGRAQDLPGATSTPTRPRQTPRDRLAAARDAVDERHRRLDEADEAEAEAATALAAADAAVAAARKALADARAERERQARTWEQAQAARNRARRALRAAERELESAEQALVRPR